MCLNICLFNARSIRNKCDDLSSLLQQLELQTIHVSKETWSIEQQYSKVFTFEKSSKNGSRVRCG